MASGLGIVQEATNEKFGKQPAENMFYSVSGPLFNSSLVMYSSTLFLCHCFCWSQTVRSEEMEVSEPFN